MPNGLAADIIGVGPPIPEGVPGFAPTPTTSPWDFSAIANLAKTTAASYFDYQRQAQANDLILKYHQGKPVGDQLLAMMIQHPEILQQHPELVSLFQERGLTPQGQPQKPFPWGMTAAGIGGVAVLGFLAYVIFKKKK